MSEKTIYDGNNFEKELCRYIGETITIFTTSGGASGSGFTGVVLSVNKYYVKLITKIGSAPSSPLDNTCDDYEDYNYMEYNNDKEFKAGSVTNIPLDKITAFVQNAV